MSSAIKNRSSLLAINVEVTAGTYVAPSAGTDFLALQEGFRFNPNFEVLENAEIRAGIGLAQPVQGLEKPTGAIDHYVRHSGTQGTAPNFALILKSLFGAQTTNGTERVTTGTASTVSVVNLSAGGTDFARGFAVMVKNSVYEIRPVHSVSTNALTLGFNLLVAPNSAGIAMGKCVNFSPANTGHPTLSLTLYRGNGGAIEMMTGARVAQGQFKIAAGQMINASYQFAGVKYHYNPIVLATAKYVDFTDDDGTFAALIAAGVYRDPHELASSVSSSMDVANPLRAHTCSYSNSTGKFTILTTGTVLSLLFLSGTNNAASIDTILGFTHTDKTATAATTGYTGASAITLTAAYTPSYDNADPQVAKNNEVLIGDATSTTCFCASTVDISVTNEILDVECICAESGVQEKLITKRTVEIKVVGLLAAYDVDSFKRYRSNADVRFCFNFGSKSGGNWVPGQCGCMYAPVAKISTHDLTDNNGIATKEITIRPYADTSGNGEFYVNFL